MTRPPPCSPEYVLSIVAGFRERYGNRSRFDELERLARDDRMRSLWDWLSAVAFSRTDSLRNALTVAEHIIRYTKRPGKPGDTSPKRRAEYFERVRACAVELEILLTDTRFDRAGSGIGSQELTEDDVEKSIESFFEARGFGSDDSPDDAVVAFHGTSDGWRTLLDWNYPESDLTNILRRVQQWTFWDDAWDDNFFLSSAPLVQAGTERSVVSYFTCMLHDWFNGHGVEIPFPLLATVANVALNLPPEAQTDEGTVRKQVRRYQKRMGGKTWLEALDEKERADKS